MSDEKSDRVPLTTLVPDGTQISLNSLGVRPPSVTPTVNQAPSAKEGTPPDKQGKR